MRQANETVAEITTKFRERALLVPQYADEEEMRKTRYHDMLRSNMREFNSFYVCPTMDDMISRAREREIDLEHIGNIKAELAQAFGVLAKKPKGFDSISKGQKGQSCCGKCGKSYYGVCRAGGFRLLQVQQDREI